MRSSRRPTHGTTSNAQLRAEYEESLSDCLADITIAPFEAGEQWQIAVKVIDEREYELLVVKGLFSALPGSLVRNRDGVGAGVEDIRVEVEIARPSYRSGLGVDVNLRELDRITKPGKDAWVVPEHQMGAVNDSGGAVSKPDIEPVLGKCCDTDRLWVDGQHGSLQRRNPSRCLAASAPRAILQQLRLVLAGPFDDKSEHPGWQAAYMEGDRGN